MTEQNTSTHKTCTKCKESKQRALFHNDKNRKDGLFPHCRVCAKAQKAEIYQQRKAQYAEKRKVDYEKNKDSYKARAKKWATDNPEKRSVISSRYHFANQDKRAEWGRAGRENNPGMYRAHFKARQQRKRKAMPAWANEAAIKAIYDECARISKETGVLHHVDHYYPLKNDYVCGLHNEYNLNIITAFDNLSKGNSLPTEDLWQLKQKRR